VPRSLFYFFNIPTMHVQPITLFAFSTALVFTACQRASEDFDDPAPQPASRQKPSAPEKPAANRAVAAEPEKPAPTATRAPAPAPAVTQSTPPVATTSYTPPAASTDRVAAPVPGLQFRLVHRDLSPADSTPEHKVVLLSEDTSNPAAPISEYEVLRPLSGPAFYVKVAPEADESIAGQIRLDTDGFSYRTVYVLTEDGQKKFREITGKIAATNNTKGNGAGKLAFVLDGKLAFISALEKDPKTQKWEPITPSAFAFDAADFSEARARESAFNAHKNK
jgi:hypothetical protein